MASKSTVLTEEVLTVIRENTVAVMTTTPEQRGEWREMLAKTMRKAEVEHKERDQEFIQAMLDLLAGKKPALDEDNPYWDVFTEILDAIAGSVEPEPAPVPEPAVSAPEEPEVEEPDFIEEPPAHRQPPPAPTTDLPAEILNTIRLNTIAVMTRVPEKRDEWRAAVAQIHQQAAQNHLDVDAEFFQALLDFMDGNQVALSENSPYIPFMESILEGVRDEMEMQAGEEEEGEAPVNPGSGLTLKAMQAIRSNTIAVMTRVPEKRDEWRESIANVMNQAQMSGFFVDVVFFQAVLELLDGGSPSLPDSNPHAETLQQILDEIEDGSGGEQSQEVEEILAAVRAFLSTNNWSETRAVLEEKQDLLFRPEVEELFEANIREARQQNQQQVSELLRLHLILLRDAKKLGIAAAFDRLEQFLQQAQAQPGEAQPQAESVTPPPAEETQPEPGPTAPGLPDDFVLACVGALRGNSSQKQQLFAVLQRLHPQEKGAETLIREVQKALFGDPLERLGKNLPEPYDAVWNAIVSGAKGS